MFKLFEDEKLAILVCGDRNWDDYDLLCGFLDSIKEHIDHIIEGEAKGADILSRRFAKDHGIPFSPYPAQWDTYGKAAGPIRNTQMLVEGKPDLVIAFHDDLEHSRGTGNMVAQSLAAGKDVITVSHETLELL